MTPLPLDPVGPSLEDSVFCRSCDWSGTDFLQLDAEARRELLDGLKPGDVVPAGMCPCCGAPVVPTAIFSGALTARDFQIGEADAPEDAWGVSLSRSGLGYVMHLMHPGGFGCELIFQISNECPEIEVAPFNRPGDLLEAAPVASLKVVKDKVLFTNDPHGISAAVATETALTSKLLTSGGWDGVRDWEDGERF